LGPRQPGEGKVVSWLAIAPPGLCCAPAALRQRQRSGRARSVPKGQQLLLLGRIAVRLNESTGPAGKVPRYQALVEAEQRDYDKARAHVEEALSVSRGLADKKQEGDALLVLAQIQIKQADLTGAADSISRVLVIADERDDDELRFYALFDRPDIWLKSCDVAIPNQFSDLPPLHAAFGDCLHKDDLAVRDYTQAREVASRQGWAGLAQQMDAFIKQAEMRAQLARSMMDRVRAIMELQNR
jgi:tetratricopeptide (TPR) repeat protein